MFAVAPSRKIDRRETERAPEDRRFWSLDMRTGAVVADPSTPQAGPSPRRRRRDDDEDQFDGPDAA